MIYAAAALFVAVAFFIIRLFHVEAKRRIVIRKAFKRRYHT